jgi:hypothetical protein
METPANQILKRIRFALLIFISLLILSGITAFPLRTELQFLMHYRSMFPHFLQVWIEEVSAAIKATPELVLYGTDWLAFAHIVIALFFIPVYRDPFRYQANLLSGMVACIGIVPLALICGTTRGIPGFHQVIDCAFGCFGILPLLYVYHLSKQLK